MYVSLSSHRDPLAPGYGSANTLSDNLPLVCAYATATAFRDPTLPDRVEEDVGGDEDDRGAEGTDEAEGVGCGHIERTCQHDAERQWQKGNVGFRRVFHTKEQCICYDGE